MNSIHIQVSSLLAMSPSSLRDLLCDPKGCHVADAFAESDSVGEKSRDGLVKALKVMPGNLNLVQFLDLFIWILAFFGHFLK